MKNDDKDNDPWLNEQSSAEVAASESVAVGRGSVGESSATAKPPQSNERWERQVIEKLVHGLFNEQRKNRRWNVFFRILFFSYLLLFFIILMPDSGDSVSVGKHTALVELSGVIAADSEANADSVITGLRAAFKSKGTAGVIVRINSPGGSPVQAGYINDEIGRLRTLHPDVPLYAVITDICASGGYYVAAAADHIYADKASLVGSIGVLMDGFGFVDSLNKLGIERRLLTAGENKGFLDPFSPLNPAQKDHAQHMLNEIHQQFIDTVKKGRGDKLSQDKQLFSGLIWSGEKSLELGLIDGLGSSSFVAREVIGVEKIVDFTHRQPYFERFADRLGLVMARAISTLANGQLR